MRYDTIKKSLPLLAIILALLVPVRIITNTTEAQPKPVTAKCVESGNADEVKGVIKIDKGLDGGVIDTYLLDGRKFAVTSIPQYKLDIYNKIGVSEAHKLMLHTLNTIECGDWDGFCLNSSDSGPFQINQIHKSDYKYSAYLVKQGKIARANSLKTGDWTTTNAIRNTLFEFQARWTVKRMETFRKKCSADKLKDIMYCQGYFHNGNTRPSKGYGQFRFWYGTKASISISKLYDYYIK